MTVGAEAVRDGGLHDYQSGTGPSEPETVHVAPTPTVVTLVHGTFARGALWTKDGSVLRREIAAAVCEHDCDVSFDNFEWSGRNTHRARVRAGHELAAHITRLREAMPRCRHFIVAHSHGGNVALLAHKHLPMFLHALGIATLGTPFIHADLPDELATATDETLREMARESSVVRTLAAYIAAGAGFVVMLAGHQNYGQETDVAALGSVAAGVAVWFLLRNRMKAALAWMLHPLSPKRAAVRLGQALALKPLPETHVLSFIYPGDEAGLLLNTLEKTTALPTRAVRWFKDIGGTVLGITLIIFLATAFFSEQITRLAGVSDDQLKEIAVGAMTWVIGAGLGIWFALVSIRYVLSFLRGHPGGFGWERPSIHAFVDIGVRPVARPPEAKSNAHQEVPFTAAEDAKKGLRHSGLYEDPRILRALAYWIAHVR